ncbi:gas vesicle protein G [Actinoplanes sp. TBRC 11911]|uniref:gas vesicle protein GvpG n=1 Tax=Actinoplanes sp. TBRC 11911 TaxID=2729386 RepID=UPI00145F2895|nr:gas vesicle protein GvpG [Actinoplanes sp. TBRC 11911]NMO50725.1 gas vesicle protein G [Actinoplanes sp. TBRC 11911]
MGGIISGIVTAPLAPVRLLTSVARVLQREAERELYDPVRLQRRLEELEEAHDAGAVSDDEFERGQQEVLNRMIDQRGPRP